MILRKSLLRIVLSKELKIKIHLVENDKNLIDRLNSYFNSIYEISFSENTDAFFHYLKFNQTDLVMIDFKLTGSYGFELCKILRKEYPFLQIVILTGKNDEINRVVGLEMGADDIIEKPFYIPELFARIKAMTWRLSVKKTDDKAVTEKILACKDWELFINLENRKVDYKGRNINLAYSEFELLRHLICNIGITQSRERLSYRIKGMETQDPGRNIDSIIKRLRKKLDDPARMIRTIRGTGYVINKR
jgi:DNA-binding response OmpR family regulator